MFSNGSLSRSSFGVFLVLVLLLLAGVLACPAVAQIESGTFVGTVHDASGAVVSGAVVTVTNVETNVAHKTTTNEQGEYNVSHLIPGVYSVSVEQAGFKTAVESNIKLDITQVLRVDFSLVPGVVSEHIEVSAVEPLVESQTSSIGQIIEE